jgi:hypothetical protein
MATNAIHKLLPGSNGTTTNANKFGSKQFNGNWPLKSEGKIIILLINKNISKAFQAC